MSDPRDDLIRRSFWSRVDSSGGRESCWPWMSSVFASGYGHAWVEGRGRRAHRVAWELTSGQIPRGLFVCHRCDNPPCCNPAHLYLGTPKDNTHDMDAKGRRAPTRGELQACHKLTEARVSEIRERYVPRRVSRRYLAREYGVSVSAIDRVLSGKKWSHVQ